MREFRSAACLFIMMLTVTFQGMAETMDEKSDRAQVGQGSRSTGITFVPGVEMAFERARTKAKARSNPSVTTEQVLIELLQEETAVALLSAENVDVNALRADLMESLSTDTSSSPAGTEPRAAEPLQNAMRRAVITALASNSKGATGADIVVAILVEGETRAAQLLHKYGLAIHSAENTKLEQYLRRNKEQAKRLAEMQERTRLHRDQTAGVVSKNSNTLRLEARGSADTGGEAQGQAGSAHKLYLLKVLGDDPDNAPIMFKAALSRNGILDLYIEQTPFEIEFAASTVVGLFEAVEAGDRLKVQLITDIEGQERVVSGFGGSAGAIFRDGRRRLGQESGFLD